MKTTTFVTTAHNGEEDNNNDANNSGDPGNDTSDKKCKRSTSRTEEDACDECRKDFHVIRVCETCIWHACDQCLGRTVWARLRGSFLQIVEIHVYGTTHRPSREAHLISEERE